MDQFQYKLAGVLLLVTLYQDCSSRHDLSKNMAARRQGIQWNLGNSNANFSKLPDFSKTTDGPDFFHYNLLQKYHWFFEFQFFEKINFSNRFVGPDQRNSY